MKGKARTRTPGGIYLRGRTWWHYYSVDGKQVSESLRTKDRQKAERLHQGAGAGSEQAKFKAAVRSAVREVLAEMLAVLDIPKTQ